MFLWTKREPPTFVIPWLSLVMLNAMFYLWSHTYRCMDCFGKMMNERRTIMKVWRDLNRWIIKNIYIKRSNAERVFCPEASRSIVFFTVTTVTVSLVLLLSLSVNLDAINLLGKMANKQHFRQGTRSHLIWTVKSVELIANGLNAEWQYVFSAKHEMPHANWSLCMVKLSYLQPLRLHLRVLLDSNLY